MSGLKYSKDHEWVRVEGDVGTVGISDYAQEQLGDVVYVELPEVGRAVAQNEEAAVVESDDPSLVNGDPTGEGWFLKLRLSAPGELDGLMDDAAYAEYVAGLGDD